MNTITLETQKYFITGNFKTQEYQIKYQLRYYLSMNKPKKKLIHKLKSKFRLVIINDGTFEEKFSYSLTPMNVFIGFSSFLVFFAVIIITLIIFTPVREYIPGYTDPDIKRDVAKLIYQTDSLQQALNEKDAYYKNILNIMNDDNVDTRDTVKLEVPLQ
jgi:hypothetical protein